MLFFFTKTPSSTKTTANTGRQTSVTCNIYFFLFFLIMKKTVIPQVFGSRTREPKPLSVDALHTTGETFISYGINVGDVIEFPDGPEDIEAREQPVIAGGTAMQRILLVSRNGEPSWLSLGVLNRTDFNRKPTCDFCAEMVELPNDYARIEHLFGKKITCKSMVKKPFQKFDRQTRTRLEGQSEERDTPIIEYV